MKIISFKELTKFFFTRSITKTLLLQKKLYIYTD